MPTVIPVKFHFASRDLWFDPRDTDAIEGDHVICETGRGLEIGLTTDDAFEVSDEEFEKTCGDAPLRAVDRIASAKDLDRAEGLADKGDEAMPIFRRLIHEEELDMKPVGVEYLFDGSKVVCYFCADERVDFRQLVRSLSRELHQRIDMRQIGVREEAALVGGFGHCGQELCCRRFGQQFEPVSIRMAKEQDLPLNSSKISGACGRLMCCLRYEFEAYRDFKQRAPKRNATIDTPLGKAKIVEYDTPQERLALRLENGKTVHVALADMQASDAAVKKSKDLGCPCRPDTVTRAALEKLQSPDVQMALAELDRQSGVTEESFDESDIFTETGSEHDCEQARPQREASATRRRHRRASTAHTETSSIPSAQGQAQATDAAHERRRKRHVHVDVQDSAPKDRSSASKAPRRRHHHSAADGSKKRMEPNDRKLNDRKSEASSAHRTRHPGDHGGAAALSSSQGQRRRGPAARASQDDGTHHTRRRRHHGRANGSEPSSSTKGDRP